MPTLKKYKLLYVLLISGSFMFLIKYKSGRLNYDYVHQAIIEYCNVVGIKGMEGVRFPVPGYKLHSIKLIMRHGDRSPISFPTHLDKLYLDNHIVLDHSCFPAQKRTQNLFPKKSNTFRRFLAFIRVHPMFRATLAKSCWVQPGELTPQGVVQLLELGRFLRVRYSDIFSRAKEAKLARKSQNKPSTNVGSIYGDTEFFKFHSTRINRAYLSGIALFHGLFLPNELTNQKDVQRYVQAFNFHDSHLFCSLQALYADTAIRLQNISGKDKISGTPTVNYCNCPQIPAFYAKYFAATSAKLLKHFEDSVRHKWFNYSDNLNLQLVLYPNSLNFNITNPLSQLSGSSKFSPRNDLPLKGRLKPRALFDSLVGLHCHDLFPGHIPNFGNYYRTPALMAEKRRDDRSRIANNPLKRVCRRSFQQIPNAINVENNDLPYMDNDNVLNNCLESNDDLRKILYDLRTEQRTLDTNKDYMAYAYLLTRPLLNHIIRSFQILGATHPFPDKNPRPYKSHPHFEVFSGHDTTLSPLLSYLSQFYRIPAIYLEKDYDDSADASPYLIPYASRLVFELWQPKTDSNLSHSHHMDPSNTKQIANFDSVCQGFFNTGMALDINRFNNNVPSLIRILYNGYPLALKRQAFENISLSPSLRSYLDSCLEHQENLSDQGDQLTINTAVPTPIFAQILTIKPHSWVDFLKTQQNSQMLINCPI